MTVNWKTLGRWAVVTGATDGIGKAYAQELAKRGLNIVLISRTREKLETVAEEIEKKYVVQTKIIPVDFTRGIEIYEQIENQIEDLDVGVLVNNVGMSYQYAEYFTKIPNGNKVLMDIINANVVACTMMMRLVLPQMVERSCGVVINVSSLSAIGLVPLLSAYGATKLYMDYLSQSLQEEYRSKGIIIQSVLPEFVATKMSKLRKSLTIPTPEEYVRWAMKTVGIESKTFAFPAHKLKGYFMELLSTYFPSIILLSITTSTMLDIRRRYYKKFGLTDDFHTKPKPATKKLE